MQGFSLEELLHQSAGFSLYRARVLKSDPFRTNDTAVLKILHADLPAPEELARLRYELENTPDPGAFSGVVPVYELRNNGSVLVFADPGGDLFKSAIRRYRQLEDLLTIAISLTRTLVGLHQKNIIHKNLNPYTIFVRPSGAAPEVFLTGFEFTSRLSRQGSEMTAPRVLEGSPAYISPEQTGRMNQFVDQRSDLYSLGILIYEMLTLHHPFPGSRDTLEWVHCHIAREPAAFEAAGVRLPETLERIVFKLLAKGSSERYQSARGLLVDLERCRENFRRDGIIGDFTPGENDRPERLQLSQNLYGRTRELDQLLENFAATAAGARRLTFVAGASGTGKSALLEELHGPIVGQSGAFLRGKFEQFERSVPYSGFIQAFGQIVRRILTEDNTTLKYWRERIVNATRSNAALLIQVLPDLELLLGSQPPVQELPPAEARNRFQGVFGDFVGAFAGLHHPLVLFLDDLQWADPASLNFLRYLILHLEVPYLYCIASFRDTGVEQGSPFDQTLRALEGQSGVDHKIVQTITLREFSREDVLQFIADSLGRVPAGLRALANLVHERTMGNPFFVRQFLFGLYEAELLRFEHERGEWTFDLETIARIPMTHNVADYMAGKIQGLSYSAMRSLEVASCLGGEFQSRMLEAVLATLNADPSVPGASVLLDFATGLNEALNAGLLLLNGSDRPDYHEGEGAHGAVFRFLHDRVQQAAYSLLSSADRPRIHVAAARYLYETGRDPRASGGDDERLFEIVGHLGRANALIARDGERLGLRSALAAELNLAAARRARTSGAVASALEFIRSAIYLLNNSPPNTGGDATTAKLRSDVEFEAVQCEYLNGNHEEAGAIYEQAHRRAADDGDRVRLNAVMVTLDTNVGRLDQAIERGILTLRELGLRMPKNPGIGRVLFGVGRVRMLLRGASRSELLARPEMRSVAARHQMDVLMSLTAAAFFKNQNLFAVVVLKMVELSLRFGNGPFSSYAYSTYGILIQSALGESRQGAEFGRLALELNQRFQVDSLACKLRVIYGSFINHWIDDIRGNEKYLIDAYDLGREHGDLVYAGYALANRIFLLATIGRPLPEVDALATGFQKFARSTGDRDVEGDFIAVMQASRNLRGETRARRTFSDDAYDAGEHEASMRGGNPVTLFFYLVLRIRNLLIFRDYDDLPRLFVQARAVAEPARPLVLGPYLEYLRGVYEAQNATASRFRRLRRLRGAIRKFEGRAAISPLTFRARMLHLQAEYAALTGRMQAAARLFSTAVQAAEDTSDFAVAALASEQAGRYYGSMEMREIARVYLERARYNYQLWGATAKVRALDAEFEYLLGLPGRSAGETAAGTLDRLEYSDELDARGDHAGYGGLAHTGQTTRVTHSGAMDVQSITHASRMISEEIVVARLLEKIMDLLLKEAGARRGCLIRRETDTSQSGPSEESAYSMVALASPAGVEVFHEAEAGRLGRPALGSPELPQSLLQYVIRTGESVIINDVEQDRVYREDRYIQATKPRSLLCMPIRARGNVTGLLYLENDLTAGAFTEERLEVLGILSAQAAVSLENAVLYDGLENRVAERTAELKATLARVQELKVSQDCDYYLTALLIQPLSTTEIKSQTVEIHSLIRQVKRFQYKKWTEQIGGDINVARSITLQGRACTVFFQGDAMGKSLQGAGGALVFGAVVESLIAGTEVNRETAEVPPDVWLMRSFQELQRVFESFHGYMLMSVMLGIIEDATGQVDLINGDHPPAVIYRDGQAQFLDEVPITHKLGAHWYRKAVASYRYQLKSGDTLVIGSDGRDDLVIGRDDAGETIINENPALFLRRVEEGQGEPERIYDAIRASGEIKDDLSLMTVTYRG